MDTIHDIVIGVPTGGEMKSKTAFSLINLVNKTKHNITPVFSYGNYSAENREKVMKIVEDNIKDYSHVLFVDCDMEFPSDTLERLLSHDKDIVGVMYNYRNVFPTETVTKFFSNGTTVNHIENVPTELFEAAAVGTGCILIKSSVFKALERPYFPMERGTDGSFVLTEDVGFCEKARDKGFKVWCDPTIKMKHHGDFAY